MANNSAISECISKAASLFGRLRQGTAAILPSDDRVKPKTTAGLSFVAFDTGKRPLAIQPATSEREWMTQTKFGFANRCLPLKIANQAGWFILNDRRLEVLWDGRDCVHALSVRYLDEDKRFEGPRILPQASSHFGYGIVTWTIPYLFRTAPGYNLYVRGPTNWCKDGICPLDAIVETDWSNSTFTMNWKVTRPKTAIVFEEGEPICMLFPQARGEFERFNPELRNLSDNPEIAAEYKAWSANRNLFIQKLRLPGSKPLWQKHYYAGRRLSGTAFEGHQLRLRLQEFRDRRVRQ